MSPTTSKPLRRLLMLPPPPRTPVRAVVLKSTLASGSAENAGARWRPPIRLWRPRASLPQPRGPSPGKDHRVSTNHKHHHKQNSGRPCRHLSGTIPQGERSERSDRCAWRGAPTDPRRSGLLHYALAGRHHADRGSESSGPAHVAHEHEHEHDDPSDSHNSAPSGFTALAQATAINGVVTQSAAARSNLGSAITAIDSCGDIQSAITSLQADASSRSALA